MKLIQDVRHRIHSFVIGRPLFVQLSVGVSMVTFAFVLLLKLGDDILEKDVISFDTSIVNYVYSLRSEMMTKAMMLITALGSPVAALIFSLIVIVYLYKKKKNEAILFSFILISAAILNSLLKIFFARPRPTLLPLVRETSYSFPSGHAMDSFVFCTMVSYFVYRNTKDKKLTLLVSVVSAILVGLIGFSRIYLGVHYPSDVLAGYATGLLWCTSIIVLEKLIVLREKRKKI